VVSRLHQPAWYWSLSLLLAGFYVGTSLYISFHRLLWYDEIFTALTSRMPNVRTIWESLSESVQQIPPLYFLITRIFDQMFRHADIGIRIPSALALGTGLLVTFDIARRLTDGLYGLIAMSFLTTSFVTYYGYEARPYALYFMLAAIALWLWVFTKDDSKTAAVAFGALFLIGVAIHYYFLLCLAPFGISALAERRIFHPKVIAAAAGVMCSLAVLYPQITSSYTAAHAIKGSLALPSIPRLQEVYLQLFPAAIVPLVLIAAGGIAFGRSRERLVTAMSSGERVSWLFLAVPLAGYILAHLVTKVLISRYIIGAVPGIAVAMTCLFWRHCRESGRLSLALLVVFGGFRISQQLRTLIRIDQNLEKGTRRMLAVEDTLQREGKRYFAVCSGMLFVEAWYYSKRPDSYAYLRTPGQPPYTSKYVAQNNTMSIEEIVAKARQTAVIAAEPALLETLGRVGLHLKVRFADPLYVVYLE
jgi:Dolichyl-phosphate-mannose-protein mannosyltransferase